jgi:hypothetical protein
MVIKPESNKQSMNNNTVKLRTTRNSLKIYQSAVDEKIQSIAEAHKKLSLP